eukprot:CAMPEP_0203697832 /NCGR_PEP_ID=MMETSP0091-20130426/11872_1 /ASSEMBLY_ACC=CAM_ASM_001089 /TAXON_ID=426623 /ORGANISM="Chaetoceros affinis, Strain CCMP159" /LENGTH=184 /DNA_ID=CAMNT_0050569915 /DNA_START=20 /DNA_END=574 /DNA_ORIENTATION=+
MKLTKAIVGLDLLLIVWIIGLLNGSKNGIWTPPVKDFTVVQKEVNSNAEKKHKAVSTTTYFPLPKDARKRSVTSKNTSSSNPSGTSNTESSNLRVASEQRPLEVVDEKVAEDVKLDLYSENEHEDEDANVEVAASKEDPNNENAGIVKETPTATSSRVKVKKRRKVLVSDDAAGEEFREKSNKN